MKKVFAILAIFLLLNVNGCNLVSSPSETSIQDTTARVVQKDIPSKVALLSELNLDDVDTYEKYKTFADNINNLISILNEQTDLFNIPIIPTTQEAWEKVSKSITKYGPLVNNYNEVVISAKNYGVTNNEEDLQKFYNASGKFAFETALIVGAVFYTASFQAVGIVYRAVGLNRLALYCGTCVGVILSQAHWTIRTALVEGSSQFAQFILDTFPQ